MACTALRTNSAGSAPGPRATARSGKETAAGAEGVTVAGGGATEGGGTVVVGGSAPAVGARREGTDGGAWVAGSAGGSTGTAWGEAGTPRPHAPANMPEADSASRPRKKSRRLQDDLLLELLVHRENAHHKDAVCGRILSTGFPLSNATKREGRAEKHGWQQYLYHEKGRCTMREVRLGGLEKSSTEPDRRLSRFLRICGCSRDRLKPRFRTSWRVQAQRGSVSPDRRSITEPSFGTDRLGAV